MVIRYMELTINTVPMMMIVHTRKMIETFTLSRSLSHSLTHTDTQLEQHLKLTFFTNSMCVTITIFHQFDFISFSSWTHRNCHSSCSQKLNVCISAVKFSINLNDFCRAFNGNICCFFRCCYFRHETFLKCRGVVSTSFVPLLTSRTFPFN